MSDVIFLGSFVATQELPKRREPKIAFLGRSNVGKSSIINLLVGTTVARISKTPGKTRVLNLYSVGNDWIFGDFPGYGFARVSKEQKNEWERLVDKFLKPEHFQYAIQIVDVRHMAMEADLLLQDWLKSRKMPHVILLNKVDKLSRKERTEAGRNARTAFPGQPLLFASAHTKEGKRELETILHKLKSSSAQRAAIME